MGKTKIKIIDDSQEPTKKRVDNLDVQSPLINKNTTKSVKNKKQEDSLIEKLKAELGVEEEKLDDGRVKIDKEVSTSKSEDKTKDQTLNLKHPISKPKPRGKKYQQAASLIKKDKKYPLQEAVELAKKASYTKFLGTVEAHINTTAKNINEQVIHRCVGKVDQSDDQIIANIKSLSSTIGKSKINKITLSPTMGPGVKVDLNTI